MRVNPPKDLADSELREWWRSNTFPSFTLWRRLLLYLVVIVSAFTITLGLVTQQPLSGWSPKYVSVAKAKTRSQKSPSSAKPTSEKRKKPSKGYLPKSYDKYQVASRSQVTSLLSSTATDRGGNTDANAQNIDNEKASADRGTKDKEGSNEANEHLEEDDKQRT